MDPCIETEYKVWEERSFGLILKTEECCLEDKLKNLYDYNNTRLVPQGEAILCQMQELEDDIPTSVEDIIKSISISSNEDLLHSLQGYLNVSEFKDEVEAPKR